MGGRIVLNDLRITHFGASVKVAAALRSGSIGGPPLRPKPLDKTRLLDYDLVEMTGRKVSFFFENRQLEGIEGESIAKALFRAGVRTLSYSVKYKRPRGIHCARGRCVMCHMEVDGAPGVPTCIAPLREGMRVRREGFRPFFAPLLVWAARIVPFPAGFYYRMFTKPAILRETFLKTLRKMAGVGRVLTESAAAPIPKRESAPNLPPVGGRYDIVVVGAGLSGLSAALSAADAGADVLLIDEYHRPGGHSIGFQTDDEMISIRQRFIDNLPAAGSLTYCPNTTVQAFYPPGTALLGPSGALGPAFQHSRRPGDVTAGNLVALAQGMHEVRASTLIFATGAYDVVPLFDNNDLPGIFGARAIRLLLERDGLTPGTRAVTYGTGPALEELTALLARHGIDVVTVVDADISLPDAPRGDRFPARARHHESSRVAKAGGRDWISSVHIQARDGGDRGTVPCDLLCTAFAGQGAYELAYQAGFRFELSDEPVDENRVMMPTSDKLDARPAATYFVVGELAGQRHWREKITAGEEAGRLAVRSQQA